jgi:HEAT repeat protein
MSHVFVSYSHLDNDFAQLLRTHLEQEGIKTWLALENLKAGEEWREGIDEAIRASYAMIVVISPNSDISKYVTYEWAFAYGIGLQIVPILHKAVEEKIHPRLENLQYEDFTHTSNRPWSRLIKRLNEIQQIVLEKERRDPKIEEATRTLRQSFKFQERAEAAKALGKFRAQSSIPILLESMNDPEEEVRLAIVISLGEIQDNTALPRLIEIISGSTHSVPLQTAAIQSLGNIGEISVAGEIVKLLNNPNEQIQEAAIQALGNLKASDSINPLIEFLFSRIEQLNSEEDEEDEYDEYDDEDDYDYLEDDLILTTFEALQGMMSEEHAKIFFPLLNHDSLAIRKQATEIVAKIQAEEAVQLLIQAAVRDAHNAIRGIAVDGLANLEKTKQIKDKLRELNDKDANIRTAAIAYFEQSMGLDGLILALAEPHSQAYWTIAERIEELAQTEGWAKLVPCLKSKITRVRAFAAEILGKLEDRSCCDDVKPLIDDTNSFVRGLAIRAVGRLQCKGVVRKLQSKLDDKEKIFSNSDNTVSEFAAIALGRLGHQSAIPHLIDILRQPKSDLHSDAAELLGTLNAISVISDLRTILTGDATSSRKAACLALGVIEHKIDIEELLDSLNEEESWSRSEAIEQLSKIEPPFGLVVALFHEPVKSYWEIEKQLKYVLPTDNSALIAKLLEDANYRVRAFTAEAIGKRPDIGCPPELIKLTNDDVAFVSGLAVRAVGRLQYGEYRKILTQKLDDKRKVYSNSNIRVCDYAAIALVRSDHLDTQILWEILTNSGQEVQDEAVELLQKKPNELSLTRIEELSSNGNYGTRIAAAKLLKSFVTTNEGIELLSKLLDDTDDRVIIAALDSLTSSQKLPENVQEKLGIFLDQSKEQLQIAAVKVVAESSCVELSSKVISKFLSRNSYSLRNALKDALIKLSSQLNAEKFQELLLKLVDQGNDDQRRDAVDILDTVGDIRVARKLLELLKDNDYGWQRYTVGSVVSKFGDASLEPELRGLLSHENTFARDVAARIVGELKMSSLRPFILKLLVDEDMDVVRSAVIALREIGEQSNVPDILPLLDADETSVVAHAIFALAKFGDKSLADKIRAKLASDEDFVQNAAISALVDLHDTDAVSTLVAFVNDNDRHLYEEERCRAVEAIGKLGAADETLFLIRDVWLNDDSCEVRFASAKALGELKSIQAVDSLIQKLDDRCGASEGRVCDAAAESLEKIGTDKALSSVALWRKKQPSDSDDED